MKFVQVTVVGMFNGGVENTDMMRIAYVLVTCGLTPCLYFLGIAENRTRVGVQVVKKIKDILRFLP